MPSLVVILVRTLAILFVWGQLALAQEFEVGKPIVLRATKPVGIPIHRKHPPNILETCPHWHASHPLRTLHQMESGSPFVSLLEN